MVTDGRRWRESTRPNVGLAPALRLRGGCRRFLGLRRRGSPESLDQVLQYRIHFDCHRMLCGDLPIELALEAVDGSASAR